MMNELLYDNLMLFFDDMEDLGIFSLDSIAFARKLCQKYEDVALEYIKEFNLEVYNAD